MYSLLLIELAIPVLLLYWIFLASSLLILFRKKTGKKSFSVSTGSIFSSSRLSSVSTSNVYTDLFITSLSLYISVIEIEDPIHLYRDVHTYYVSTIYGKRRYCK